MQLVAPAGEMRIFSDALLRDSGAPDPCWPGAELLASAAAKLVAEHRSRIGDFLEPS
jgi:hypothetical protein